MSKSRINGYAGGNKRKRTDDVFRWYKYRVIIVISESRQKKKKNELKAMVIKLQFM